VTALTLDFSPQSYLMADDHFDLLAGLQDCSPQRGASSMARRTFASMADDALVAFSPNLQGCAS